MIATAIKLYWQSGLIDSFSSPFTIGRESRQSGLGGFQMKMFERKDVVLLLHDEVKRAGSQDAFAKKTGIDRTALNKVLNGTRLPSPSMIDVLGLAPIYVFKTDLPLRNLSGRR